MLITSTILLVANNFEPVTQNRCPTCKNSRGNPEVLVNAGAHMRLATTPTKLSGGGNHESPSGGLASIADLLCPEASPRALDPRHESESTGVREEGAVSVL